jgi:hypothetical protein
MLIWRVFGLVACLFDELAGGHTMAVLLLRSILRKMSGVNGVSRVEMLSALCFGLVTSQQCCRVVSNVGAARYADMLQGSKSQQHIRIASVWLDLYTSVVAAAAAACECGPPSSQPAVLRKCYASIRHTQA